MPNISEYPGYIFTYFSVLVVVLVEMIRLSQFVWRSPKGRCYGNQLNLGDVHRRHVERPLFFAWAFYNGLDDRKSLSKGLMAIIRLHRVQIWWTSDQQSRSWRC